MIIKGTFTSLWDNNGAAIVTLATLDTETGEVTAESVDVDELGLECLDREFFTDTDDNEYKVCTTCHEYILKSVMVDGVGSCLDEVQVCSNKDCESHD